MYINNKTNNIITNDEYEKLMIDEYKLLIYKYSFMNFEDLVNDGMLTYKEFCEQKSEWITLKT